MTEPNRRVLMIALDALETATLEKLIQRGALPNLREFTERTMRFDVASDGAILHGSIWPTFAAGAGPGEHGVYFWIQWLAEEQREVRNDHPALAYEPFWSAFPELGRRALVVDVPYVPTVEGPGMRVLQPWGLHDEMVPTAYPASFRGEVVRRFGKHPLSFDTLEPQSPRDKLRMARDMAKGVAMRAKLIETLAAEGGWDLFVVTFGELHKAGHYLAGPQQLDATTSNDDALARILRELDAAWPRIEAAAGPQTDLVLFALHGMAHQVEYSAFGPQLIHLVLGEEPVDEAAHPDLLRRLREVVPDSVHRAIWKRLPARLRAARQATLSAGSIDTVASGLFRVTHDGAAAARVNLAGRERDGFVGPAEYEKLLGDLAQLALGSVAEDGQKAFVEPWRQGLMRGPRSHRLPDALLLPNPDVVRTATLRLADGRLLSSTREEARNGVHTGQGFCFVRPAGEARACADTVNVRDFAPTVLGRLGVPVPPRLQGVPFLR